MPSNRQGETLDVLCAKTNNDLIINRLDSEEFKSPRGLTMTFNEANGQTSTPGTFNQMSEPLF